MPNLTANIPHRLTRAEVRRRIEDQLHRLRQEHGALLSNLHDTWTGDRMDFAAGLMGQKISGHLIVEDQVVRVEVELPWLLSMLTGTVKQRIEQQGTTLLARS